MNDWTLTMTCPRDGQPLVLENVAALECGYRLTAILGCGCGRWVLASHLVPIETPANEDFGTNLARRRLRLGCTQKGLAHRLHVTESAIGDWETGRHAPPAGLRREIVDRLQEIELARITEMLTEHAVEHPWNIPKHAETLATKGM